MVIQSTDIGAVRFTGTEGGAIPVLDYILVTKLGWSKEFSGLNKAVYRPSSGNRLFYRVDDTRLLNYQGSRKYKITIYESMSDVDTGSGASTSFYLYKSNTVDTTQRDWIAIGDASGVYIRSSYGSGNDLSKELSYIGDGIPLFSNDFWFSIITGRLSDDYYVSNFGYLTQPTAVSSVEHCICTCRSLNGSVGSVNCGLMPGGGLLVGGNIMGTTGSLPASMNYPVDGKLMYTRPLLNDGRAQSMRGYFPGLYSSEHGSGLVDKQVYSVGNKSLMALMICPYNNVNTWAGWVLIDIGEGFRLL